MMSSSPAADASTAAPTISTATILWTILSANAAMLLKQGSLLLGWFYATRRAAWLGTDHLAAHQVGLSVWLIFAFLMDGASVAAQILMSRAYALRDRPQVQSLIKYMLRVAVIQGLVSMLVLDGADLIVPQVFTTDPAIRQHLRNIIPHLAWQQLLVSGTLLVEGLAVGMRQFRILAAGTTLSTLMTFYQIGRQSTVEGIWSVGIVTLFAGRLLTATLGCVNGYRGLDSGKNDSHQQEAIP
jgi:Na+-driven multidrug efflux pump